MKPTTFNDELDEFFADPMVGALIATLRDDPAADPRPLYRRLGRAGLLAPSWPSRYGGRESGQVAACRLLEAIGMAGCPDTLYVTTMQVVGTVLVEHADEALKDRLLPELAAGNRFASVLFSEFDAGSDLVGMAVEGVAEPGGGWRVSGRKTWSVHTPFADDALCAFRVATGNEHVYDGFALGLLPLDAEGVRINALPTLGAEAFHEVELTDVLIPPENLVGEPGAAWPIISGSISSERTGFDYLSRAYRWLTLADESGLDARETAPLWDRYHAARFHAYEVAERTDVFGREDADAALVKLVCSELAQRCAYLVADRLQSPRDALDVSIREAPGLTMSAGASEVLIDLVATALPATALDG
ncbi:acyl-CoA dehydrogenase family protein [Amycolatopsis umgeniensis]|uniref:Alkylation response protein AidB-like acyl-CoA dehydrogenase n=1 Tax=Amycolatopsis umgeniensis TaxID=336628 RepID=A0A841BG46_9PSEU|nr:alkylation response protein AidB-like acyl-CoA dehydrogenase [Amycolatopsis umgeniensis]